jgi:large subunit ribosomal protein L34e
MVLGKTKSRTFRRVKVRTITKTKTVYKRRKPKLGTDPKTGETLKGVKRELPGKMKNIPKSQRRPSRPFGGVLSSKSSREEIKKRARS